MADTTNTTSTEGTSTEPTNTMADTVTGDQSATDTTTDNTLGDPGKAALDAERKARRQADKDLKAALAKIQSFEDANKSETERLSERATAAETAAQDALARYTELATKQAIYDAANAAGTTDPESVYLWLKSEVELADDGTVTGVDKAMKALQARKPHLFRTTHEGYRDATNTTAPPALNSDALTESLARAVGAR